MKKVQNLGLTITLLLLVVALAASLTINKKQDQLVNYLVQENKPNYPETYFYMRAGAGSSIGQVTNNFSHAPQELTQHLPHKDIPIHFGSVGVGSSYAGSLIQINYQYIGDAEPQMDYQGRRKNADYYLFTIYQANKPNEYVTAGYTGGKMVVLDRPDFTAILSDTPISKEEQHLYLAKFTP